MYVIIIGAGEVGRYLGQILVDERHDVAIIEQDEAAARRISDTLDVQVVHGTGVSRTDLRRAGIEHADLLLAVTQIDEVNLVAAMTVERLNPKCRTVARVRNRNYLSGRDALAPGEYGIDMVVGPERAVADQVVSLLHYVGHGQITSIADDRIVLLEFPVQPHSTLAFTGNDDLSASLPTRAVIAAVLGDEGLRIAEPADRFQVGEHVFVLCAPGEVNDVLGLMGSELMHVKRVLLIGGGSVGQQVASALERMRFDVTILEKNRERAEQLASVLSRSLVIQADGTDPEDLIERLKEGAEAVVTLVPDDSESLLAAIVAARNGAKKVIARVDNQAYTQLAHSLAVDSLISPRRAIADQILRYVRRSRIVSTTMLGNHQGEIIDFEIDAKSKPHLREQPIGDLKLPKGCMMGVITRSGDFLRPERNPDAKLSAGDHVVVVALREAVAKIEELFS
jgi:trk system potassium uptake protein TrkA